MNISKELAEELNPDNKQLTAAQWRKKLQKYEEAQAKKQKTHEQLGERPGVCECGNRSFSLRVLKGKGFERTCRNPKCRKVRIV